MCFYISITDGGGSDKGEVEGFEVPLPYALCYEVVTVQPSVGTSRLKLQISDMVEPARNYVGEHDDHENQFNEHKGCVVSEFF